ncbi:MAG TPA: VWA domain-containing protein [Candidatus Sulfotelmatobacter sp.]|nr:VWA domain-containing protein [Candidatus Sulfotelmatobacter sp.]
MTQPPIGDPGPGRPRQFRYSRWDGTQRLGELDADEALAAMRDDLLADGDLTAALRRLLERGMTGSPDGAEPGVAGLRDLLQRIAAERRQTLERYGLGEVMPQLRQRLEHVLETERRGIDRRVSEAAGEGGTPELRHMLGAMAERRREELAAMPEGLGERIRALEAYDFLEPEARTEFQALLDQLRGQVLDAHLAGLAEQIRTMSPEALAANRAMVRELNQLLQERLDGGEPDAAGFLARHGAFFPGARTLDDVIEQLTERMAAMQSLLASMTAAQRAELQSMMDALLRDDRLRWDLAELASTLDRLLPGGLGQRFAFRGDEGLSLEGALDQLGRLQRLDRLADGVGGASSPGELATIDQAEVRELLGEDAARELEALQRLTDALEAAGYVERHGERVELTARGSRRIGQGVLDELFARLQRDAFGTHPRRDGGAGGERAEVAVPYEFGRPFDLDLRRTLANALAREAAERMPPDDAARRGGRAVRRAVKLAPDDLAVYEHEDLTSAATVLLLDMSRSMLLRGCFLAAKKVAVAMDTLIRTRFPQDQLHVVGFAYYAREIPPGTLAALSWQGYEYGTNLQHGLLLARRLLARSHATNREIVVITDGEPTAHFEDGQVRFSYPPTRRTIQETLAEVGRCTREGITINTFMLERSRALADFVAHLTRLNRGRAFYATPERLGEYILVDYVGRKTRRV